MTEPEPEPKRAMVHWQRRLCPGRWAAVVAAAAVVAGVAAVMVAWQGSCRSTLVNMDQVRGVGGWGGDGCRAVAVAVAGMSRGS